MVGRRQIGADLPSPHHPRLNWGTPRCGTLGRVTPLPRECRMPSPIASRSPLWWARWVPAALLAVAFVVFLIVAGSPVLIPLLLSFALTFMLEPLVEWFQRHRLSRSIAVLAAMSTAIFVVLLILLFLLPSVWHQLQASIQKVPDAIR